MDFSGYPLKVFTGNEVIETKSVIIATGATAKRLGLPGEKEYRQKGIGLLKKLKTSVLKIHENDLIYNLNIGMMI